MGNKFLITTTNNVEGCSILKYIDSICTNIVIGTNIFSDMVAGLSDIFGGHSGTYRNKLEKIYGEAKKGLQEKANALGANAIIGFSVDFDEISGGGKSMFMISASGTACIVKYPENRTEQQNLNVVTNEVLERELKKLLIVKSINEGRAIQEEWMEFLLQYPQKNVVKGLLTRYVDNYYQLDEKSLLAFTEKYLTILPQEDFIDDVYCMYPEQMKEIGKLINACMLFSPEKILDMFDKLPLEKIIYILNVPKQLYKKEDLIVMQQILDRFDNLPETGKIEVVKGGMFSKDKEMFICEQGHKNDKDLEYCSSCGLNIKGLTKEQVKEIESFRNKVRVLETLL